MRTIVIKETNTGPGEGGFEREVSCGCIMSKICDEIGVPRETQDLDMGSLCVTEKTDDMTNGEKLYREILKHKPNITSEKAHTLIHSIQTFQDHSWYSWIELIFKRHSKEITKLGEKRLEKRISKSMKRAINSAAKLGFKIEFKTATKKEKKELEKHVISTLKNTDGVWKNWVYELDFTSKQAP